MLRLLMSILAGICLFTLLIFSALPRDHSLIPAFLRPDQRSHIPAYPPSPATFLPVLGPAPLDPCRRFVQAAGGPPEFKSEGNGLIRSVAIGSSRTMQVWDVPADALDQLWAWFRDCLILHRGEDPTINWFSN